MEESLLAKTGKSLDYWINVLKQQPLEKHGQMVAYLKTQHSFTHGFANFVALKAREADAGSSDASDLISAQYAKKPDLKPVYDLLNKKIMALGKDVEGAPKKANVSYRVKRQFALVQPSTKTRIDLGLKFNDRSVAGRLEASGPFGTMCTHRVQITSKAQVDKELIDLIKAAYIEAK